jgi:site-specific DNA-methyltransferase (adenine-specific)
MPTQLPLYTTNALPLDEAPLISTSYGLLYQTDCLMLLGALKENVLDCIFADPPFNLGKQYGNGEVNDTLGTDEYLQWSQGWLKECIRVLKPGGALFVYIRVYPD